MSIQRYCYRCTDCLAVVFANEFKFNGGQCGACGGQIEFMGQVCRDRLVKKHEECACDGRCTHARGPSCECKCGGANHGTGATVFVTVDCGPVPRFNVRATSELTETSREWRWLLASVSAKRRRLDLCQRAGEQLANREYQWLWRSGAVISKAKKLRTHKARIKLLAEFCRQLEGGQLCHA